MRKISCILDSLLGGDLRSIGKANQIVATIGKDAGLFDQIFQGIFHDDPLIRMRSADVAEKVSCKHPSLLEKHKTVILASLDLFVQQEVKWHIALMLSYLELTDEESELVFSKLSEWIKNEKSRIVVVNSIQALATISIKHPKLKQKTLKIIESQMTRNIPSIISRGKKLMKELK